MMVEEIPGEPFRFHVSSKRLGIKPHLVDLEENDAFGKCGCERFYYSIQPRLNEGRKHDTLDECGHIRAAQKYLLKKIVRQAIENSKK